MTISLAVFCVIGISIGQILFKFCAKSYALNGLWNWTTVIFFVSSIFLYGITTLGWIYVLSKIELGKVYPIMALAFVIVPILASIFFNERYNVTYYFGIALIVLGISLASKSSY